MIMTAAIDPDALAPACFAQTGYQDQVAMFFRGIESNGAMLLDSDARLLDELEYRISELPIKYRQDLEIRFAEFRKKPNRGRLVKCRADVCKTSSGQQPWERVQLIGRGVRADAVFASPEHCDGFSDDGLPPACPLSQYTGSRFEEKRRWFMDNMPNADRLRPSEFDEAIARVTRFSRWIRFFDKQIGKGKNVSNFRRGIERVLTIWRDNAHFQPEDVEIVTALGEPVLDTDDAYTAQQRQQRNGETCERLKSKLVAPLKELFPFPIRLYVKAERRDIFRNRYLQTEQTIIHFSEGFDLLNDDGSFRDNILQVRNQDFDRLADLRRLRDYEDLRCGQ